MINVGIDTQTTLGQPTGFGFYVSNLVRHLKKFEGEIKVIELNPGQKKDFSTPQRFVWDQITLPRLAKKRGVDLFHQPSFSAPFLFKGPMVVTVHDIISILFPENIPLVSRTFYSKWMPYSYRNADEIITISDSTKSDITRVLKIPKEKISVIPLAYDPKFDEKVPKKEIDKVKNKYGIDGEYILHIGTLEPRKNLSFLVDVFTEVIKDKRCSGLKLVITGKKGWYYEDLFDKVRRRQLGNKIIFTGYIDEQEKAPLYSGAMLFAFPSLYEGFGLPPLEAMACGVPVLASDVSSIPEVVGDAGILLEPNHLRSWVKNVCEVCANKKLREKMREDNKKQTNKFSWDKTAKETIKVYKKAYSKYE